MLTGRRVAVVGSREFKNYKQLERTLDALNLTEDDMLVSGGATGADTMAYRYAKEHGLDILVCLPNWNRHGKGAGFIRNRRIAKNADLVLAFYQKGRFQEGGTANTAKHARDLGIELREYEEE